jgi:hypothetical protein
LEQKTPTGAGLVRAEACILPETDDADDLDGKIAGVSEDGSAVITGPPFHFLGRSFKGM